MSYIGGYLTHRSKFTICNYAKFMYNHNSGTGFNQVGFRQIDVLHLFSRTSLNCSDPFRRLNAKLFREYTDMVFFIP